MITNRTLLLTGHILAAVLFLGPFTVAASAFPRHARRAHDDNQAHGAVREAHRISRSYGTNSLAVPALGIALAADGDWWTQTWLQVAIALTIGWVVAFFAAVLPTQRRVLDSLDDACAVDEQLARLHLFAGIHALLWTATLALMVIKPW